MGSNEPIRSRADAVTALLAETPFVERLRRDHEVSIYTFDSDLVRQQVYSSQDPRYLQAIGTAAVVLGELLSGVQVAGACLVIFAIILLQIRRENAALAEPQPVRE